MLGSATPSLESWATPQAGKYTLLTLPARVGGASLPEVEVVDLRTASTAEARAPACRRTEEEVFRAGDQQRERASRRSRIG